MEKLNKKIIQDDLFITDEKGVNQPAWKHEDGTIVSHWTGFDKLLIQEGNEVKYI